MNAAEKTRLLHGSPVFGGLAPESLAVLAEMMHDERFVAGSVVCVKGEPADSVFVVASGTLAVFVGNDTVPVRELGVGDVLGEYGMFGSRERTATVRAVSDAALLSLDYERLHDFLFAFPDVMWAMLRLAVERLADAEARLT